MLQKAAEVEEIFKRVFATHPNLQGENRISMRREIDGKTCVFHFDLDCISLAQVTRPLKSAAWHLSMLIDGPPDKNPFAKAKLTVTPEGDMHMVLVGYLPTMGRLEQVDRDLGVNVKDLQDGEEFLRLLVRHFMEGLVELNEAYLRVVETLKREAEQRCVEMDVIRAVLPGMFP